MHLKIKSLFFELGVEVDFVAKTDSPNYELYHYNVRHIYDFKNIKSTAKTVAEFLKKSVTVCDSTIAHFALALKKDTRDIVYFLNSSWINMMKVQPFFSIFMGIDNDGYPVVINLNKSPHILVAGTTGSGKSCMINNIICNLLKYSKGQCRFTLIDTKKVELSKYKDIENCNVVTNAEQALDVLSDICNKIDYRYDSLNQLGVTKIDDSFYREIIVIEELNDLMMASKKSVEKYLVKISQLGRACGIHLILATQRPVVSTVTGDIKANIDCRVALKTTSYIDSRNILGHNGAEELNGNGDAIIQCSSLKKETRIQTPFLSPSDIEKIIMEVKK